jgi:ABC-type dipeptide/oligopeptide/nickel transport system permease subunit
MTMDAQSRTPPATPRGLAGIWRGVAFRDAAITALVVFLAGCVVLPPFIWPHDPNQVGITMPLAGPSAEFPFGADALGRDVLSRLLAAAQIAVLAAVEAVVIAIAVGGTLGLIAAYAGGLVEYLTMRLADFMFSFPGFLVAIILIAALGPGLEQAALAIGLVYAPRFIRVTRVEASRVMKSSYVEAARLAQRSAPYIMVRHLLPNISTALVVLAALSMATAQLTYASLAFLGFGARAPQADYGEMLSTARVYMLQAPMLVIAPAVALAGLVLCFNILGDLLRDRLDPRGGRHNV